MSFIYKTICICTVHYIILLLPSVEFEIRDLFTFTVVSSVNLFLAVNRTRSVNIRVSPLEVAVEFNRSQSGNVALSDWLVLAEVKQHCACAEDFWLATEICQISGLRIP